MRRPVFHQTDIFHPHADPDDHWDLACNYALASAGHTSLLGVMIDYPPWAGDPAIGAVAQMNFITGLSVPVVVGTSQPMTSRTDIQPDADSASHAAVNCLLEALRNSVTPVVINIVGSCRDIALAALKDAELFEKKCAAVYLNAGTGSPDIGKSAVLEYNVQRNPASYAAIFDLPCPVYWMPCWDEVAFSIQERKVMEWGTHYKFRQSEIMDSLSSVMQNYFLYMLDRSPSQNWLKYLLDPVNPELLAKYGAMERSMWSTAGFFHGAGLSVDKEGNIIPLEQAGNKGAYTFEPVSVTCDDQGVTRWSLDQSSPNRFKFHVLDLENYQPAMIKAMRSLLMPLTRKAVQEQAKMEVPVELYRGLYAPGSLKNTVDGFQFVLKNNLMDAVVTGINQVRADNIRYESADVSVKTGNVLRIADSVTAADPVMLSMEGEAIFVVKAAPLSKGQHTVVLSFNADLVGKVEFDIADNVG
jgi:hypothetical protein